MIQRFHVAWLAYRKPASVSQIFFRGILGSHLSGGSPPGRNFPGDPSFALIICYVSSSVARNCGRTRTAALARARLRDSRVYLAISILLSEQCICSRRRKVFRRVASCGGGVQCPLGITRSFLCICMHIVCVRGRTRTDAERNVGHRSREAGYKHLLVTIGLYGLGPGSTRRRRGPLTSFNGGTPGNLSPKVLPRTFTARCALTTPN